MKYNFTTYYPFDKEFKRLSKKYPSLKSDILQLQKDISTKHNTGIDLGGGLYKLRMSVNSKSKGKSGGARIISLNILISKDVTEIGFLYIYDKSERSNISNKDIQKLLQEI